MDLPELINKNQFYQLDLIKIQAQSNHYCIQIRMQCERDQEEGNFCKLTAKFWKSFSRLHKESLDDDASRSKRKKQEKLAPANLAH